jgi:hypothetical protein
VVLFCTVAMTLTLQPAFNYQPDLCGDGIFYNPRGGIIEVDPGATEPYLFEVVNAGAKTDTIKLKGAMFSAGRPGDRLSPQAAKVVNGLELRWFKGANDVTNKVMAGKLKFRNMPSGALRPDPPLRAEVTAEADATGEDNAVVVLTARSQHKPTRQDIWSVNVRVGDPPE